MLARHSKWLSWALRHQPEKAGIILDANGWADVSAVLDASGWSRAQLDDVVATNSKKRFEYDATGAHIRARQGHSVDVDLELVATTPPAVLYHGTYSDALTSIMTQGLLKGSRHHVHMTTDRQLAKSTGGRRGRPVVLEIDAAAMLAADHRFFVTANAVWLTEHVPPMYLRCDEEA